MSRYLGALVIDIHILGFEWTGSTPLHLSASAGNLAVCELLIKSGASLLEKDSAGLLAKDIAQLSAQHQISRYLQAVAD